MDLAFKQFYWKRSMLESNLLHVSLNTRKSDNKKIEKINVVSGLLFWKAKVVLLLVLSLLFFSYSYFVHLPQSHSNYILTFFLSFSFSFCVHPPENNSVSCVELAATTFKASWTKTSSAIFFMNSVKSFQSFIK